MFVLNGKTNRVLSMLDEIGFSEYAARAYFALLVCGEMKAGQIARMSGVPQPKIYITLQSLCDDGHVFVSDDKHPKKFKAIGLQMTVEKFIGRKNYEIERSERHRLALSEIIEAIRPSVMKHTKHVRLFAPSYRGREKSLPLQTYELSNQNQKEVLA